MVEDVLNFCIVVPAVSPYQIPRMPTAPTLRHIDHLSKQSAIKSLQKSQRVSPYLQLLGINNSPLFVVASLIRTNSLTIALFRGNERKIVDKNGLITRLPSRVNSLLCVSLIDFIISFRARVEQNLPLQMRINFLKRK